MMIQNTTQESMDSLVDLFTALRDDPRMNEGEGIVAIGRPEPAVPGAQYAHVRVAYEHEASAARHGQPERRYTVHTAAVRGRKLSLGSGHYDLTKDEAWAMVSGRKFAS